jgi:hypothetical protein
MISLLAMAQSRRVRAMEVQIFSPKIVFSLAFK